VLYQPIVDLASGRPVAVEDHPGRDAFTDVVLRKALAVLAVRPDLTVNVAISGRMARNPALVAIVAAQLAEHGVQLAVHDFGTGYSSLSFLRSLPVGVLKVGASTTGSLIGAMLELGGALGLRMIATGVGGADTRDAVRDMGFGLAQGSFLGRPVPLDEIATIVPEP
jgi:EAL domain-containing protein (putative c-di-GMP-specific phosphodiesterase class I)